MESNNTPVETGTKQRGRPTPSGARRVIESAIKQRKDDKARQSLPDDDDFRKAHPNLWDWMTTQRVGKWEKDAARVSIQITGSVWKASLSDDSLGQSCAVVALTLREALARLDAACVHADTAWSVWKGAKKGLREVKDDETT